MTVSEDAAWRGPILWIVLATALTWAVLIGDLARGGRPDPPPLRGAATLLDGAWRFHAGDDLRWADFKMDDRGWQTVDLTAEPGSHDGDVGLPDYIDGWSAHGHRGYTGYAWYRRDVDVPAGIRAWDVLGPTAVEDGYELYWNGRLLGGSGRLGPNPRVVGTRPMRFALPADAAGTRGVLAVRVIMLTQPASTADGGGVRSPPILAPRPVSDELHRAQWERTVAGYILDAVEPLAMLVLVGLAVARWPSSDRRGFLLFASIALTLTAARRFDNALVAWTDLMDLRTYSALAKFMWMPTVAAWALAWNRWCSRSWRAIDVLAIAIMVAEIVGATTHLSALTSVSRHASIVLLVVIGVRIARDRTTRALALTALAMIIAAFFGDELLDPIGVPGIWFPFGIGVSRTQYIFGVLIPLVALFILRPSRSASSSDRPSGVGRPLRRT